jgi:Spondin_N
MHDFPLCQNGSWITSARIPLFPYDLGTFDGDSFSVSTTLTDPVGVVAAFLDNATSIFADPQMCAGSTRTEQH